MKTINAKGRLTNAEFELMEGVWRTDEPITSATIMTNLANGKDWKPTTVLTLLGKLADKGYIAGIKQGRSYVYTVLVSREEYLKQETTSFLSRLYQGSLKNMVAALYDDKTISREDLDELARWFKEEG